MDDILDVGEWVKYAREDYDCATSVAETNNPYAPRIVCYLCQQAVEKILKAYIIAKEGSHAQIHDLEKLLRQCGRHVSNFGDTIFPSHPVLGGFYFY